MTTASGELRLAALTVGTTARVERLEGHGPVQHRLREMGVTAGVQLQLLRLAPLGDPLEVSIRGYRLSLRREEAAVVIVRPITPPAGGGP